MLRLLTLLSLLLLATPALAARCGGDFNTFVAAMSAEAQAAGISQGAISQALSCGTQAPARHLQQVVRAIYFNAGGAGADQHRPGDAAASRFAIVADRAAVRRAAQDHCCDL